MNDKSVYHITFSCNNRFWLFKSPRLYRMLLERIETVRKKHGFKVYAYVLMPNHVHLILYVDLSEIVKILSSIKRPFSYHALRYLQDKFPEIHRKLFYQYGDKKGYRFWQAGKGSIIEIRSEVQLSKTIEYLHHNPVKRELVDDPIEWTWSSYRYWMKRENKILKVENPYT